MSFLGVYRAIYDYAPQGEGELAIREGDVLYVLEKSTEDDWWKAKKKASADEDDEPVGLVPNNYVEEVCISTWPPQPGSRRLDFLLYRPLPSVTPALCTNTRDRPTRNCPSPRTPS